MISRWGQLSTWSHSDVEAAALDPSGSLRIWWPKYHDLQFFCKNIQCEVITSIPDTRTVTKVEISTAFCSLMLIYLTGNYHAGVRQRGMKSRVVSADLVVMYCSI
jgi:hypothetical protein